MEIIKCMVMEVVKPSATKKYVKKNRNVNSRLATTGNTIVVAKKYGDCNFKYGKGKG